MGERSRVIFVGNYRLYLIDRIHSFAEANLQLLQHGGKVVLPQSALRQIIRFDASSPFIMRISALKTKRQVHCGVISFEGKENEVRVPLWIHDQLKVTINDKVKIYVLKFPLRPGTFAKFQPLSLDFLNLNNPKKVLESSLSHYTCLDVNVVIDIFYNKNVYKLFLIKTEPDKLINITNCDLEVDFDPPTNLLANDTDEVNDLAKKIEKLHGLRLDGKPLNKEQTDEDRRSKVKLIKRGIPDFDYKIGQIKLFRQRKTLADDMASLFRHAIISSKSELKKSLTMDASNEPSPKKKSKNTINSNA